MQMKKALDVNDLEAQFAKKPLNKSFIVGGSDNEDDYTFNKDDEDGGIIEFNDNSVVIEAKVPVKKQFNIKSMGSSVNITSSRVPTTSYDSPVPPVSYASTVNTGSKALTVEELEAQFRSGITVSPKSPPTSQLVGAGPPPGLPPGLSNVQSVNSGSTANSILSNHPISSTTTTTTVLMSSTAPLPKYDPNHEFMNRFERNLIMKIHTTQLTTETPLMDDFYYQALTKKKATMANEGVSSGALLYFPLPSAAERQRELQRRERRRRQREKEREKEKEKERERTSDRTEPTPPSSEISADLVLGKISNSSARKPRQQLQVPTGILSNSVSSNPTSLHESVMKGIESVYNSILSVEDFYLIKEEVESRSFNENEDVTYVKKLTLPNFDELIQEANQVFSNELNLVEPQTGVTNHKFIHFLTISKGRSTISRVLKLLSEDGKKKFLKNLVEHFDFLEIVRPETSLSTIDSFILQVLSPLVGFVGEADWQSVLDALKSLFAKRSFVWIALTKAGMVLLCILLSRLEILKATGQEEDAVVNCNTSGFIDESSALTEKMFDSLEGHLLEFFSSADPSRDFYAWQCLALLAMNVESDRKRSMILELRDKILVVVEKEDVKNLNVFLNALGLDASQLK